MNIDKEMQELINLLDNNSDIKKVQELKKMITDEEIRLINDYRCNPVIFNKKKLYDNEIISEYLIYENNINYLIMQINNKFKRSRVCPK